MRDCTHYVGYRVGRAPGERRDSGDQRYRLTRAPKRGEIGDTDLEQARASAVVFN
jgi:hypothetical protein